jgi:putative membrane protein
VGRNRSEGFAVSSGRVLKEATFSPRAVTYQAIAVGLGFAASIVGIPLIVFAVPIAILYWTKQYSRMQVILTSRDLKVNRGVLVREEKAVPLEKITDLATFQGPLMRYFGLKGLRVETAGQSGQGSALVKVIGIEDTDEFRELVLRQRDRITESDAADQPTAAVPAAALGEETIERLRSIDETLRRIEKALQPREDLLLPGDRS